MQGGSSPKDENIVSIFSRSKKEEQASSDNSTAGLSFEEIMRRNMENKERLKKDRAKANQSVIRSYRLKPR